MTALRLCISVLRDKLISGKEKKVHPFCLSRFSASKETSAKSLVSVLQTNKLKKGRKGTMAASIEYIYTAELMKTIAESEYIRDVTLVAGVDAQR